MGWLDKKVYKIRDMWLLPTDTSNPKEADQRDLKPDPKVTAHWLAVEHPPRTDNNPVRAIEYRPWRAFKLQDSNYSDMLRAVGLHSTTTIANLPAERRAAHKDDIDAIKQSLNGVLIERAIDHSKHILDEGDKQKFKLATREEPGFTGKIVDWDLTKALPEHQADITKVDEFKTGFYANDPKAMDHITVMQDFRAVQTMYDSPACSVP